MIEILIVAALVDEFTAIRDEGLVGFGGAHILNWTDSARETPTPYLLGTFALPQGPRPRVALARPTRMGPRDMSALCAALVSTLKPYCVVMSGVCAGNPAETALGDVVIAEAAYAHDEGKKSPQGFQADQRQYPMPDAWLRVAQEMTATDLQSYGEPTTEETDLWLLERFFAGADPRWHPARSRFCPNDAWLRSLRSLERRGLIDRSAAAPKLTEAGRTYIEKAVYDDVEGPKHLPLKIHVGPMASGSYVASDGQAWLELRRGGVRKVLGLEMEAAALASVAHQHRVPFWLVAKGVMDHADPSKDDRYKPFAARAAAEVMWKFLAVNLPATLSGNANQIPEVEPQGPFESGASVATLLSKLDEAFTGRGSLVLAANRAIEEANILTAASPAERIAFRRRLADRGLDGRLVIPNLSGGRAARERWAVSKEGDTSQYDSTRQLNALLEILRRDIRAGKIVPLSATCLEYIRRAELANPDEETKLFLDIVSDTLHPIVTRSTDLVPYVAPEESGEAPSSTDMQRTIKSSMLSAASRLICALPREPSPMHGRAELVSKVVSAVKQTVNLGSSATAFLSGHPGVGTSAVAISAAKELSKLFPGGTFYVNTYGLRDELRRDVRTLARILGEALELDMRQGLDNDGLVALVRQELSLKHALLVLDDALDTSQISPFVPAPENSCVIVTSRNRVQSYADADCTFRVEALSSADSIAFLSAFVETLDVGESAIDETIRQLADMCAGIPLALHIMGTRMRGTTLADRQYLVRLLEEESIRLEYLEEGERAVSAAIALSYESLSHDAKELLTYAGAVPGSVLSGELIAYGIGGSGARKELALNRLVDRSLARHVLGPTAISQLSSEFVLFNLVQLYAEHVLLQKIEPDELLRFRREVVEFLAERIKRLVGHPSFPELQWELDPSQFHAALLASAKEGWVTAGLEIARDLDVLYRDRKEWPRLDEVNTARVALHSASGNTDNAVSACLYLARLFRKEKYGASLEWARRAVALAEESDLRDRLPESLFELSLTLSERTEWADALDSSIRAYNLLSTSGDHKRVLMILLNISKLYGVLNDKDGQLKWAVLAVENSERYSRNPSDKGSAYLRYGYAKKAAMDFSGAVEVLMRAESQFSAVEEWWDAYVSLAVASKCLTNLEKFDQAVEQQRRALTHLKRVGDASEIATATVDLSALEFRSGRVSDCLKSLERSPLLAESGSSGALSMEIEVRKITCGWLAGPAPEPKEKQTAADRLTEMAGKLSESDFTTWDESIIKFLWECVVGAEKAWERECITRILELPAVDRRHLEGPFWLFEAIADPTPQYELTEGD
jgi:nucleoside phosphorylase